MKVLFLDIDGVLNSARSVEAFGRYPWTVKNQDLEFFDKIAVSLIRKVCQITDAKIVLSSTWRHGQEWYLIGQKLRLPIFDRTPSKISLHTRGEEVAHWLMERTTISKYAIIDDDQDFTNDQLPFFVHVNTKNGLMLEHFDRLIEILGKKKDEPKPEGLKCQKKS